MVVVEVLALSLQTFPPALLLLVLTKVWHSEYHSC
jgi:hypothetical protein